MGKDYHILIQRDDKDYHLNFYIDSYGTYTLGHIYDLGLEIKRLSKSKKQYVIRTEEDLRVSDHKMYAIAKVLELLEATNCGCCNAPFLREDTFEALVKQFRYYEGVI